MTTSEPPADALRFVAILAGDADLLSPPALMRLLAAHIPDCELGTIP